MKKFIVTILIFTTTLPYYLKAQQISSKSYNNEYIHEDFNGDNTKFMIVTNNDNYFILDQGDYLLSRNNNETEYAIIVNNSKISDFVLKTAIKIGPSENKKASIGIILKAQNDGKGAVIFEINKQAEYRVKQLVGNVYQTLSSDKNKGWVKSSLINGIDKKNLIEIRSEKNIYEVYTNGKYLTTFFVPDYNSGSCGLIISPETKARVSYYHIYTKGKENLIANLDNEENKHTNTIEGLEKRVKLLEEKNNITNEKESKITDSQNLKIKELNFNNKKLTTITKKQKDKISDLENQIKSLLIENKNIWNDYEVEISNISKLQQINVKNQSDIAELNSKINTQKNTISNLNKKNTEFASVTLDQEKQLKTLQKSADNLRDAENKASAKNKLLNKKILEQEKQLKEEKKLLEKEILSLKTKNSKIIDDQAKLRKSSARDSKEQKSKIKKLELELQDLEGKNTKLTKRNSSLNLDLTNTISSKKKIDTEVEKLRSIQAKHDNVITKLNNEIKDLNNKNNLLNSQLIEANDKNRDLESKNAEIKELFILKDFELNGVKPSEFIQENTNKIKAAEILTGNNKIYTVQIAVYMQEQSYNSMRDIDNLWYSNTEQGTYIYYSGEFNQPEAAAAHMKKLIAKGYDNAFVVTLNK